MTKTIILAATLALAGCATAPGTPVTTSMAERAYALHEPQKPTVSLSGLCHTLGDFESNVRQGRAQGLSLEQSREMTAMIALESGEAYTRHGQMSGALMFMAIDHVYEDRPGSVVNRCLDERWPQAVYIATL